MHSRPTLKLALPSEMVGQNAAKRTANVLGWETLFQDGYMFLTPPKIPAYEFLKKGHVLSIGNQTDRSIAERMVEAIDLSSLEHYFTAIDDLPKEITFQAGLGQITELRQAILKTLLCKDQSQLVELLSNEMIPLMRDHLGVKYILPVHANPQALQTHLSFYSIATLIQRHGHSVALSMIEDQRRRALDLTPFGPQQLLDALVQSAPMRFSFPIQYAWTTWHFYTDGAYLLPKESYLSLNELFSHSPAPRAPEGHMFAGLAGNWPEPTVYRFLSTLVRSINNLHSYILDPHNNSIDGEIQPMEVLKAQSHLSLLIADISTLTKSTDSHIQISFSFSALEKMGALRNRMASIGSDKQATLGLLCASNFELISKIFERLGQKHYPELSETLVKASNSVRDSLEQHLSNGSNLSNGQKKGLENIWSLRNLHHGSFLSRNQFETLIDNRFASVTRDFPMLAYLNMLALALEPTEFCQQAIRPS